ncbi:MAG TPA: class I SAM-dependent methyltransferase [Anaerolineaceae bacterium]
MLKTDALPSLNLLTSPDWIDYELLDSGQGLKLERFGSYRLIRPEAEAIWQPALPEKTWLAADAVFQPSPEENGGHWSFRRAMQPRWKMAYHDLHFWAQTSASRHLGVFPEQACQWDWIEAQVRASQSQVRVLNLFGYTGLATLAAAHAGAEVTHLDASKKAVTWARENLELSGLNAKPVRWIVDDALKFVQREARRGASYEGIILDPPKFGRGPKGEVWEFYRLLPALLEACTQILSKQPLFMILTAYAVKASSLTLHYAVRDAMRGKGGETSAGELTLPEKSAGRAISMAVFARWSRMV